jgi:hypothetical protein|tara:strand:- start:294 stop:482 length:189 start_codon:yes stop_codon:yes gene_type:complete
MSYNLTNLSLRELRALRKSTNYIPITGIDAIFIGTIQVKLDQKIKGVEKQEEEDKISPPPVQ